MELNINNVTASLEIMWKGMAGLFVVCGFIMLLTMLIAKVTAGKKEKTK